MTARSIIENVCEADEWSDASRIVGKFSGSLNASRPDPRQRAAQFHYKADAQLAYKELRKLGTYSLGNIQSKPGLSTYFLVMIPPKVEGVISGEMANYGHGDVQKDFNKLSSCSFGFLKTLVQRYDLEVVSDSETMINSIMSYLHGDNWLDKLGKS